ncbi:hypothetical protein [Streptomyces sp. NPDC058441]|uniref:hypothetical protein n=1 Tax=Streptomyces sp. NPDC058441 TaxID=3346502 RepID=UPI003646EDC2
MQIRRALGAVALVSLALVSGWVMRADPNAPAQPTSHVKSWNQGFADSKQDDCEQGFKPACAWLATNH